MHTIVADPLASTSPTDHSGAGRLLVVDDLVANRQILRGLLQRFGYEIEEAEDGESALELIEQKEFDTVLLDIMMPKMDGFEVCHRLKSNGKTEHIPILLITALSDRDSRLKGMHAGADEFLSKPFDSKYLPIRIQNAVRAKRLHDQVEENYHKLKASEELRDGLVHMIVHDLRSPLFGIHGNLELHELDHGSNEEEGRFVGAAMRETKRMIGMVNDLLDIHRLENHQMPIRRTDCELGQVARDAVETLGAVLTPGQVTIEQDQAEMICPADRDIILRIFANFFTNAAKFSREGAPIEVRIGWVSNDAFLIEILDAGPGIPLGEETTIFEKFGQVPDSKGNQPSSGLGLNFCKLAIEAHGGRIGVDNRMEGGSRFWFILPILGNEA